MRYPEKWAKWSSDNELTAYHNTLLYTDAFLEYSVAREKLNLHLMLYFSDHGDNLKYGHHPDIRTPDTVRIPMFIFESEAYKQLFPEKIAQIEKHKKIIILMI